ncbi:hypothetical protein CGRA01v4_00107 [Colletotrichum graminicola]|uniref:CVNH domain-containing protein n=1 Tax=Colletotrichum graminicola (strain M1.001 / M2 / FGSC 10212) TaxID=645133 RepID=E3QUC7_COLGM|nr:uncharacterized protein GLRG_09609 [Colletotrichum graminicola M1.001]EFQ34465.1 hypothetical protein GLRG_09609 [Colletotrichum graminicola M1.001]WDK08829.1 hypothetical protein CGRA01v4_00107 [Colletotrichum graminicola]
MKTTFTSVFAATAALASTASAFSITNCVTGQYKNFGEAGNKKCQNFNAGNSLTYDSNKGLTLRAFQGTDCQGASFTTTVQNACQGAPFTVLSVIAN